MEANVVERLSLAGEVVNWFFLQRFGRKYIPRWHTFLIRHHVDTCPIGAPTVEMEANMVKSLSLAGEVFLAGEVVNAPSGTARTHVSRWKTLDCLSDPQICLLGPHITGWSPPESDSYHNQLGPGCLWWLWTDPPHPCIPLAPINPIHGLMLFWPATIRLPICLLDLHLMKGKYLFKRPLELMNWALPGTAFTNTLLKALDWTGRRQGQG